MKLIISGVPPWDGDYQFDGFSNRTNREYHRIKEISGVRAGELLEALSAGDTGAWVGFTVVVLASHGKDADPDDFWNAQTDAIDFTPDDDADPPTQPPSESEPTEKPDGSGTDSTDGGE